MNTYVALVELGKVIRTIDLEALSFFGIRHCDRNV
jgi:hypothetical protein